MPPEVYGSKGFYVSCSREALITSENGLLIAKYFEVRKKTKKPKQNFFATHWLRKPSSTSQPLLNSDTAKTSSRIWVEAQWTAKAAGGRWARNVHTRSVSCPWTWVGATRTSAQSVGPSEDPALLDLSERGEHDPDVVLVALLRHHADEQLPVLHRCRAKKKKKKRDSVNEAEDCAVTTLINRACAVY